MVLEDLPRDAILSKLHNYIWLVPEVVCGKIATSIFTDVRWIDSITMGTGILMEDPED